MKQSEKKEKTFAYQIFQQVLRKLQSAKGRRIVSEARKRLGITLDDINRANLNLETFKEIVTRIVISIDDWDSIPGNILKQLELPSSNWDVVFQYLISNQLDQKRFTQDPIGYIDSEKMSALKSSSGIPHTLPPMDEYPITLRIAPSSTVEEIKKWLDHHGDELRRHQALYGNKRARSRKNEKLYEQVQKLLSQGLSYGKIGMALGLTYNEVSKIVLRSSK